MYFEITKKETTLSPVVSFFFLVAKTVFEFDLKLNVINHSLDIPDYRTGIEHCMLVTFIRITLLIANVHVRAEVAQACGREIFFAIAVPTFYFSLIVVPIGFDSSNRMRKRFDLIFQVSHVNDLAFLFTIMIIYISNYGK